MLSRVREVVGVAIVLALLFPRDASAYIDPGSGSLIFQTIVATLAGIAYGVRVYWSRIRGWFGRRVPDASISEDAPGAAPRSPREP